MKFLPKKLLPADFRFCANESPGGGVDLSADQKSFIDKVTATTHQDKTYSKAIAFEDGKVKETQASTDIEAKRVGNFKKIFEQAGILSADKKAAFDEFIKENLESFFANAKALDTNRNIVNWNTNQANEIWSNAEYMNVKNQISSKYTSLLAEVESEKTYQEDKAKLPGIRQKVFDKIVAEMVDKGITYRDISFEARYWKGLKKRYYIRTHRNGGYFDIEVTDQLKTRKARLELAKSLKTAFPSVEAFGEVYAKVNDTENPANLESFFTENKSAPKPVEVATASDGATETTTTNEATETLPTDFKDIREKCKEKAEVIKTAFAARESFSVVEWNNLLCSQLGIATDAAAIKNIQTMVGTYPDGKWGPHSQFYFERYFGLAVYDPEDLPAYITQNQSVFDTYEASVKSMAEEDVPKNYNYADDIAIEETQKPDFTVLKTLKDQNISSISETADPVYLEGEWGLAVRVNFADGTNNAGKHLVLFVDKDQKLSLYESRSEFTLVQDTYNKAVESAGGKKLSDITDIHILYTAFPSLKNSEEAAAE